MPDHIIVERTAAYWITSRYSVSAESEAEAIEIVADGDIEPYEHEHNGVLDDEDAEYETRGATEGDPDPLDSE